MEGKRVPGCGSSKCKGPGVETCWPGLRVRLEAVADTAEGNVGELRRERDGGGERTSRAPKVAATSWASSLSEEGQGIRSFKQRNDRI